MNVQLPETLNKPWLIVVVVAYVGGLLIFGSLLWFLTAHLGQIFAFVMFALMVWSVKKENGVSQKNGLLLSVLLVVALVLLFVPLDFVTSLREASIMGLGGG